MSEKHIGVADAATYPISDDALQTLRERTGCNFAIHLCSTVLREGLS